MNVNSGLPADGSKPVTPPAKLAMVSDWGTDDRVPAATMLNVKWLPLPRAPATKGSTAVLSPRLFPTLDPLLGCSFSQQFGSGCRFRPGPLD